MASFLDYMNGYGESDYEKKKKKKEEEERRKKLISPADEIAPVKTYTPTSKKEDSKKEDDSKKDDDERTWFKKGAFADGYDFGDITKTILGTVADIGEDIGTGIVGMGEKVADALAMAGTTLGNAQMSQLSNDELAFSALKNAGKDKETKEKEAESIVKKYTTAQKDAKKGTTDFVKKDLYDEEEIAKKIITTPFQKATGINVEDSSVLGEKSDSLIQSGGQLLATAGLQALGVPWFLTTGATSFGAEAENALNQGATFEQATMSAAVSAGAEILTEKLSGGIKFGGKTLDDVLLKPLTEKISSKALKTLTNLGVDALGEGAEEVVSGVLSNLGSALYKEDDLTDILFSEEAVDEYIESFIGGAALGGFSSGVKTVANRNAVELSENEQKVFDKVVEDRITEATEDGKKTISKKDESKIRNDVLRDMLKGYIDTDTIESLLGGEEYDKYKSFTDKASEYEAKLNEGIEKMQQRHDELQKEYNTLNKMKTGDMTGEQLDRRADIKKEMASLEDNIQQWNAELEEYSNDTKTSELKTNLKTKLGQSVFDLVKDSRLAESYREIERSKQKFETDVSKYKNENARQTVQNAIDSGLFGNGNRAKEFVDFAAKLSADRGYVIEFTDTKGLEKLKQEGNKYNLEADANRIEAFVSDKHKRIVVNADAHKSFDSLIGHEITHTLESAKSYEGLHKAIKSYLGDAEYNKTLEDFKKRYKGVNAVAEKELVAEFCGTKLLTDYDFVKHLSTENRNVFQKVWDEIKYLYKFATAGSKEARDLEKVKRNFEKAYKESANNTDTKAKAEKNRKSDTQYSITVTDKDTIDFLENQEHITTYKSMQVVDGKLYPPMAAKVKGADGKYHWGNPSTIGVWQQATEDPANIKKIKNGVGYYTLNKGDGTSIDAAYNPYEHSSNLVLNDQFESAHRRDNLVTVECVIPVSEMSSGYRAEYSKDPTGVMEWKSGVVAGQIKDNKRMVYLSRYLKPVRILSDAETASKYKDILEGTGVSVPFNVVSPSLLAELENAGVDIDYEGSPMYKSIQKRRAEKEAKKQAAKGKGDTKYSLSAEQEAYFKDSKVRDENGNLKVMYHGTSKGKFTVFDTYGSNYGLFGQGSYFTDNKSVAESYTNKGKGNNKQVYESYLNITNPLDMDAQGNAEEWAKAFPDVDFPESGTNEQFYRAVEEFYSDQMMPKWEVAEEIRESIQFGMGYDGITHIGGGRFNKNDDTRHQVYIAFEPEQIKNIDNVAPTKDADIRYSLTEDSEGNKLTEKQSEYFKDSKAVDRNGNLLKVYHTTKNDFTVFDKSRKGEATEDANTYLGFFFSDDAEYMQNFPEFENGKTESYYLDMKNPIDMTNISREAFMDIVEVMGGDVGDASILYDEELEVASDRAKLRGDSNVSLQLGRLLDELTGEFYYQDFIAELKPHYDELMSKGYDGVINYMDELFGVKEYIVLDSHQAKLTSNLNPTADADVRYSLTEEEAQETNSKLNNVGLKYDNGTVSYSMNSLEDAFNYKTDNKGILLNENDYLKARNEYVDALAKSIAAEKGKPTREEYKKADRYLDSLFLIHDMIAADKDRLDYEAAINRSAWVGNVEYGGSIDFSTLCAKRRLFTGTFDAIQNALPDTVLTDKDFLNIRNLLLGQGEESPCSMCYVEGSRAKHGVYVDKWLKEYLKTNPEWKPQIADFTSTTRLEQTRIQHPEAYKEYVKAMNKLSQRKPKEASVRTDYKGEILDAFKNGESVEQKNLNGGIRFNSFSDFEIIHALDCMQVLTDMARVGLNGQAYTKVKEFAEAFGNTGLKINLSLVAKDVDANGKLVMDEVNGMNYAEAKDIRNRYSDNVGTVIVVFNDAQLKAALSDNTIDYVLPFHRSQWRKAQYALMGLPDVTRDYTNIQNDRYKNPKTGRPKKAPNGNIMPNEYWDFNSSGRENAQRYLDYINENSYIPKFDFLLNKVDGKWVLPDGAVGDGYFKLLIDFKMYNNEGVGSPQNPVLPEFNMPYIQQMLNNYVGGHQAFPVAHDVVNEFVEGKKNGKYSLSDDNEIFKDNGRFFGKDILYRGDDIAPVKETTEKSSATASKTEKVAPTAAQESVASAPTSTKPLEETPIRTTKQKLSAKLQQSHEELEKNIQLRKKSNAYYDEKIAKAQAEYDAKKNKDTKAANNLLRSIERYKRLKGSADADYKKRIYDIESRITKLDDQLLSNHDKADRLERYKKRADARLEADKKLLKEEFEQRKAELQEEIADKNTFVRNKALALYNELDGLRKGVRASEDLAFFLDEGFNWSELKSTLLKVSRWSDVVLNPESEIESIVRESIGRDYEDKASHGMDDLDAEYDKQVKQLEEEAQKKLDEFKVANQRMTKQQEYTSQMEELVGDTSTWVDKKLGISYETNTLRRNLRDIVRDSNGKKNIAKADAIYDELQGKYNHNEAELNRESNRIKQQFAEMKITKAEDTYIQMLGEFRHNPETTLTEEVVKEYYVKNKKHIDEAKVDKAIEESRKLYDDLLVRVNQVLSEQGMKEIPYRKGYFPHFTEDKQSFLGKLFNWKTQNNEIPTDIAGITETFEPNRSWQSFNKQRKTDETDYSFTKGLDSYVQGSLDWIYHIEDIQKRRALENHIRYTHSEDGVKAKVDAILNSEVYDADQMQEQIDLVYREARNPLNNFIQDFHTATNTLAGKKSTFDRDLEQRTNRKVYSVMTNLSNRVSGNMVAGSVSSALTNFIPITQSWVEVSPVTSLRAMGETIKSTIRDDGMVDKSDFLTNRLKKAENLYQTFWDKAGKGVGFLMDAIDGFTSQTVWRSKYIQNMSRGMSESEAIKNADQFAANVMADRSRGNQPTLFDSKSPVAKIFTAFQLEVNNQYGYFFKDAPQDIANKSKARLVAGYTTAFFGAYAYNALYSSLTGRDAAFDPIGIIEDLMRDLGFGGDDDEEEEIAPVDVVMNLTNNILEEVPFVGGLLGGGRIPISSAMPYGGIMEAFEGTLQDFSEGNYKTLTKEWLNPVYYLALPMGGGQIRKTNQGVAMFSDDHPVAGSYTDSGSLRFPVEKTPWNVTQAAVFGQYANKNARTYFDEDYAPLKENQIKEYAEADMPIADYWKYREGLKDFTKQDEKAAYINGLDISKKQKDVLKSYLYDEEGYKKENPEKYAFLEREGIGYIGYKELDEDTQSAWSWAFKHQDEYEHYKENGVLPGDYSTYYIPMLEFEDEDDEAYQWSFDNPEKATVGKVFGEGVKEYRQYAKDLNEIKADEDENGNTISGSAKEKKKAYIWSLPLDYGQKIILYRSLYDSKDDKATYNQDILDYLFNRDDLTYEEVNTICEELGFTVNRDTGYISWD